MNYLLFAGSLRSDSLNKKLIKVAAKIVSDDLKSQATIIDLKTLSIPVYDGDVEILGMPAGVLELADLIKKTDAIIISTPEYNSSIPGMLKNVIDWVSRIRPNVFENKPVLLLGASPGYFGAIRSLGFARAPFEALGSFVYPQTFALPKANEAFSPIGELSDEGVKKRLVSLLHGFSIFVQKLH